MAARSSLARETVVKSDLALAAASVSEPLPRESERLDLAVDLGRDRLDALGLGGIADHQRRLGVGDEIVELVERIGGVERQIDGAGTHGGEVEHQALDRFLGLRRDAVADLDAALDQHIGHLAGAGDQIAIGDALAVMGLDRKAFGVIEAIKQA